MDKILWEQLKPILEMGLSLDMADRDAYLHKVCSGNTELYQEASKLLANENEPTLNLAKVIAYEGLEFADQEGRILGHYKLLREIGRGGMGAVYLAERTDGEYEQKVAIKILHAGRSSELLIRKLRNERQILANLKHPNIVNILDGGTSEQGIPFIVMEYVDGTVITDYIEDHHLNLNQRLLLFQKLCEVISFAHQKLIIHRDIKPSNILIDQAGEIKLLDFGIAKILNPDSPSFEETQQLFITLDYASPEHIKGQPLGISSEVYSLGILFYQILTGINPFKSVDNSLSSMMEIVCKYYPPPPSKQPENTNTKLRGDLDNICLKALRKDPKERYHSVDHFSQDLDRYLQHLPVKATKDQWTYRAKKFIVRNNTYILSGVVIFLITLAGLFTSLYQAGEAKAMFNDLRGLTGSMLFEFYDGVASLEGATGVKELVVSKTLTYLEKMESRNSGNADLMNDVSDGYQRLGRIQGNTYYANMGLSDDALKSYKQAVRISENLVDNSSTNQKYMFSLSQAYLGLGDIMYTFNQLDTSLLLYQKSNQLLHQLAEKNPDTLKYWLALSESFNRIGDVSGMYGYSNLGNTTMSLTSYNKSIDILEKLIERAPENIVFRNSLAVSLSMLANLYTVLGKYPEAIENGYKSIAAFEALLKEDPNNYLRMTNLLQIKNIMREPLSEEMRTEEAYTLLKEVEIRLIESQLLDPKNMHVHENLAINYNAIGRVLELKGEYENALKEYQKSYSITQKLAQDVESNFELLRSLGFTIEFMANAHFDNKQYDAAVKKYAEAIDLYKKSDIGLILVAKIKSNICNLYLKDHQATLLQEHQNDLLTFEQTIQEDTLNIKNVIFLSEFYGNTALALARSRKPQPEKTEINDPCYYFRRSLELAERLSAKKVLSPLRKKKRDELFKSLAYCSNQFQ